MLAPSYVSGAHAWNGTTAALRNSASSTSTTALRVMTSPEASAGPKASTLIDPVAPYSSDTPMRNVADAAPLSTKYLNADSALCGRRNANNTSAYTGIASSSRPRNITRKLSADGSKHRPYNDDSSRIENSPSLNSVRDISRTGTARASSAPLAIRMAGVTENWPENGAAVYCAFDNQNAAAHEATTAPSATHNADRDPRPSTSMMITSTIPPSRRCSGSIAINASCVFMAVFTVSPPPHRQAFAMWSPATGTSWRPARSSATRHPGRGRARTRRW